MSKRTITLPELSVMFGKRLFQIVSLLLLGMLILLSPGQNIYTTGLGTIYEKQHTLDIPIPSPHPYPVNTSGVVPGDDITASAVVIRDADSGTYMYKRNERESLSPASTTKLLTALVILDRFKPDDIMTVNTVVSDGQVMGLFSGEQITVENLLYGMLIHSGNDAAYALAENYPGGYDAFIRAMNKKARSLSMTDSVFTNPIGFDDPAHKVTAIDLTKLAMAALYNPIIVKMVAIPAITISDVTHTYYHSLKNINELIGKIPGVAGMKTGWTEEAGENLITLVDRNGHKVIFVVLHSADRFGDTTKLIDWAFSSFEWKEYKPK